VALDLLKSVQILVFADNSVVASAADAFLVLSSDATSSQNLESLTEASFDSKHYQQSSNMLWLRARLRENQFSPFDSNPLPLPEKMVYKSTAVERIFCS
jgi:hypothetical protein